MSARTLDRLGSASLVVASGLLFAGWVVMYPVAVASGGLLDRIRAEESAWDLAHRLLLIGAIVLVGASLALGRALRRRTPALAGAATMLLVLAAVLSVGQYALDYAVLAASDLPPSTGDALVTGVLDHPFVSFVLYDLADIAWAGLALAAVAMWMQQDLMWKVAAIVVAIAVVLRTFDGSFGVLGPRISHGVQFLGFAVAALAMVRPTASDRAVTGGEQSRTPR